MFNNVLKKIFGTSNERYLKSIQPIVAEINALEPSISKLSDAELKSKTAYFKERLAQGATLDDILVESFAVVREVGKRILNMRHFDVQLLGGVVLHRGRITEMKTGEGKTLVATLPVYLNALSGKGSHVVTVNDYLARRDSDWMGKIYNFLEMNVGVIVPNMDDSERKKAYGADITYGTNNEFGFDYLRDNMKFSSEQFVQRPLNYCIVDEVDSILIDEARTPLIISGPAEQSTKLYYVIDGLVPFLKKEKDYTIDEKARAVALTEEGVLTVEKKLNIENLYDPQNIDILHHVNQALRAHSLYKLDVDYVINDGQVVIVDEFTGRLMQGRRWGDGLHQAVEAKEKVKVENENQTLATITFQNFFRMYEKLSGMTGTADTEAEEFAKIYNLDVNVIPTHLKMIRDDQSDLIYKTQAGKYKAVVNHVRELYDKGQPVLVGTISIDRSELISKMLKTFGIPHHILNAKHHDREAEIVSQAGRYKAVTISTNMAGRGTDIMLGGNPEFMAKAKMDANTDEETYKKYLEEFKALCAEEKRKVIECGGLKILGTERHESRRIDNQLRGRSGRQGDPGATIFYLSLEDDLLRVFGGERISSLMDRIGMTEEDEIQHSLIARAIENAQKRVEGHNFQIRKNLLEYDDVMNQQRSTVYSRRREMLSSENNHSMVCDMIDQVVTMIVEETIPDKITEEFDSSEFEERVKQLFNIHDFSFAQLKPDLKSQEDVGKALYDRVTAYYNERTKVNGEDVMRQIENFILLHTLDGLWKDNLLQMDHLKEGIGLRGYGQKNPLLEYKKEGYMLFKEMMDNFVTETVGKLFRVQVTSEESIKKVEKSDQKEIKNISLSKSEVSAFKDSAPPEARGGRPLTQGTVKRDAPKVGRNDPCTCGSGKKFKKCCGK
ncbi:MAG: preprotein translocase subunit SecA [Pseudomonadota bacterium]